MVFEAAIFPLLDGVMMTSAVFWLVTQVGRCLKPAHRRASNFADNMI